MTAAGVWRRRLRSGGVVLDVTVPGVPVPQGSKRVVSNRAGRAWVIDDNDKALRPWRAQVQAAAMVALTHERFEDWDTSGPFTVELEFCFPRLKSHLSADGSVKPSAPSWKPTRPDVDKLSRAVLDALTDAGVWADDSQVVELGALKVFGASPGLQVFVYRPIDSGEGL